MKKTFQNSTKLILAIVALLLAVPTLQGCGGGGGGNAVTPAANPTGAIRIAVPQPGSSAARVAGKVPSSIATLTISVTGSELDSPLSTTITYPTDEDSVSIANIPAGLNTITAIAYDSDGSVIAHRVQKVTIIAGTYLDVTMTLGFTLESGGFTPSSIAFNTGEPIVIKNNTGSSVTAGLSATECGGSQLLGSQGQIKCYPSSTGNITISSASNSATAVVSSATNSSLKAAISANITYGEAPLYIYLDASYLSSSTGSGAVSYSWSLGGGTSDYSLTSSSVDASFSSAGDYTVTLTVTQGTETAQDTIRITVVSALPPEISSISPTSHLNTSAGTLTISGNNFKNGATVKVGTTAVTASISSSSVIYASIPTGFTTGTHSITVTNPDGQSATLSNAFTVTAAAPTVTAISPTSQLNSSAGTLTITGTNFQTGATVTLNSTSVTATVNSATSISATIPSGFTAGTYTVTVTNPDSQSASASQTFTVAAATTASCSALDGTYWMVSLGGSDSTNFYSHNGDLTLSGLSGSVAYTEGDSFASDNDTFYSENVTIIDNGDGTYTPPDGSVLYPNNDCSFFAGSGTETGSWDTTFLAKRGSASDYAAMNPEGNYFGITLKYEKSSGYKTVVAGEYVLSAGNIGGTVYYINNMMTSESSLDVSTLGLTYSVDSSNGAVTVDGDTAQYKGGVSYDGNIVILGTSNTAMQSIIIMVRKPTSFTFSDGYGQWRGISAGIEPNGGETCRDAMYMDSSNITFTGRCHHSYSGDVWDDTDIFSTSDLASYFATNNDGSALAMLESPGERMFIGEGGDIILTAETPSADGQYISVLFKTDQSVPTGQPPTANAGADQSVTTGASVTLDGTGSSDPDGDTFTYDWFQISGPTTTLSSETAAQPTFTPSANAAYVFGLKVDDNTFISATDTVIITATGGSVTVSPRVSAGSSHSCGVTSGGAAMCWGYNASGQLGDGTSTNRTAATQVSGLTSGVVEISAGDSHSCAVLSDNTVKCWGDNSYGQLGDGTSTSSTTPVAVSGISTATKVVAGFYHSCAMLGDGTVKCWGDNTNFNQLGNGTSTSSTTPVAVSGVSNAVDISVGCSQTCVLIAGGTVMCWGRNDYGQAAGDGSTSNVATPVTVSGVTGAGSISAGQGWSCTGLTAGGTMCWGYNGYGQFGNGGTTSSSTAATAVDYSVTPINFMTSMSAGEGHTCGVTTGGLAYCWGYNLVGQLGDGTTTNQTSPTYISTLSGVDHISAGGYHSCAVTTGGAFYCWGDDSVGAVGNNGTSTTTPVTVSGM